MAKAGCRGRDVYCVCGTLEGLVALCDGLQSCVGPFGGTAGQIESARPSPRARQQEPCEPLIHLFSLAAKPGSHGRASAGEDELVVASFLNHYFRIAGRFVPTLVLADIRKVHLGQFAIFRTTRCDLPLGHRLRPDHLVPHNPIVRPARKAPIADRGMQ
jgi:hypothetical protein